ncbi:MAG TPA: TadE family type IV pilus minor pilin [Microbacteriaceae bacterium]|nr:TadE family type IV pilus minor pilin [Microbacteriaceae bacterium]
MTAELAVALPAVLVVLAGCLGCVHVVARQAALVTAAATVARSLARGDDPAHAGSVLQRLADDASFRHESRGDLVCVDVSASAGLGPSGPRLPLSAHACALAG